MKSEAVGPNRNDHSRPQVNRALPNTHICCTVFFENNELKRQRQLRSHFGREGLPRSLYSQGFPEQLCSMSNLFPTLCCKLLANLHLTHLLRAPGKGLWQVTQCSGEHVPPCGRSFPMALRSGCGSLPYSFRPSLVQSSSYCSCPPAPPLIILQLITILCVTILFPPVLFHFLCFHCTKLITLHLQTQSQNHLNGSCLFLINAL